MFTKAVVLAAATLTTVALAGCTGSPQAAPAGEPGSAAPAGGTGADAPRSGTSAGAPRSEASTAAAGGTGTTGSRAPKPTKPAAGAGDAGDGGNWLNAVKACPDGMPTEIQRLERADVTGDGVAEALVARTCEPSTSRWPSTVEVFDGTTGEKPRRIGVLLEDAGAEDHPWFTSLTVSAGTVTVKAHGVGEGSPMACPNLKLTYSYRYDGGRFTRVERKATESADCLPID